MPPLQGFGLQSSTSVWQLLPAKPGAHAQVELGGVAPSLQVPPFKHGLSLQPLIFSSQFVPEYPLAQSHT